MASHDPKEQIDSINSKISTALHKIGEVYKSLLLKYGKEHGLSPIQIQILIFIAYHEEGELRTISYLAQELNLTKPTVSDAVRVLFNKGIVEKLTNEDTRSYSISLTRQGTSLLSKIDTFDDVVLNAISSLSKENKSILLGTSLDILSKLEKQGVIGEQRMCLSCKHLTKKSRVRYCGLIQQPLTTLDLRVDCEEFVKSE